MNRTTANCFTRKIIGGVLAALGLALFAPAALLAQTGSPQTTFTLTFEGLHDNEEILDYYNGGKTGDGTGPGPNYGVSFGSGALALTSILDGGEGNFEFNPSGITTAYFLNGGGLVMNVPNGFQNGFSFYYAAAFERGAVTVYSGVNKTGSVLATIALPVTGSYCNGSNEPYSCWNPIGVTFTGVAMSVDFGGSDNGIGFDNITLGSSTPTSGLVITTASLASGTVGVQYNQPMAVSGGISPYHWSAKGLPSGLTIDSSSGVISGAPKAAGTFTVTINVSDSTVAAPALTGANTYALVISPANPVLTSLVPNTAPAGSDDTVMVVNGSGFNSTSVVTWTPSGGQATNLATVFQSAVALQATIPAALLTTPGTADVVVMNGTLPSSSATFTITPPLMPSITTLSPNGAEAGSSDVTMTVTGTNFIHASVVQWTPAGGSETDLATAYQSSTSLTAVIPAALITDVGTATVTVVNAADVISSGATFTINAPAVPVGLNLAIPTPGVVPTDQPAITVNLSTPALADYTGTIMLSFTPASGVSGWPGGTTNSQVVFAGGTNTTTFTIAKGSKTGTVPSGGVFQQGTVAGTITATITVVNGNGLPSDSQPSVTQTVKAIAPVITTGSVHITGLSATGFTVELDAYSTTRDLTSANFTFQAASGTILNGATQTVSLSSSAVTWFSSTPGIQAGGAFHLSVPFAYSGDTTALGGVSVTLANSAGTSSGQ